MKPARLLLPVASFAAAAFAARFWPKGTGGGEFSNMPASAQVSPANGKPKTKPGQTVVPVPGPEPSATPSGLVDLRAPSMDEVFAATGLDRLLLMASFIQTASGEELKAVIDRAGEEQIDEPAFSEAAWLRWVELDLESALKHHRPANGWWAYAKLDPRAALARALETGPSWFAAVLRSIGQSDPALARRLLAEHQVVDEEFVLRGLLEGLGKLDPAAATALALEKDPSIYLEGQFTHWMRQDPEGALAWMRGLTKPADRRRVEDLAIAHFIANDPAAGLKEVLKLPPGLGPTTRTVEAIAALSRQDPAAARAAADALPSPYARQKALAALAVSIAPNGDPAMTADLVSSLDWKLLASSHESEWNYVTADGKGGGSGGGYSGEQASEKILAQLMTAAPQVTADALAASVGPPEANNGSPETTAQLVTAVQKWAARQPEEASTWLRNQPPGAARDEGITGLAHWLTSGSLEPDYAAALAWAGAASAERQFSLYQETVSAWKRNDPQAAAAAVEALPLPSGQRDQLRAILFPNPSLGADPLAK